jgi:hypothetical protein
MYDPNLLKVKYETVKAIEKFLKAYTVLTYLIKHLINDYKSLC